MVPLLLDSISLEVLNSKLISIAEEMAVTLLKTSFSAIVREARDFTCTVHDKQGNLLAQAPRSLPAFAGCMHRSVREFLKVYPLDQLEPGDVLISNNPWIAIGHLPDLLIVTPVWRDGEIVAIMANAANVADIGGRQHGAEANEVYEEGLHLPVLKLYKKGEPNTDIFRILEVNVRMADEVLGDVHAQVAANDVGARRLLEFMDENGIDDLGPLSAAIQERAEQAMRRAIASVPDGVYRYATTTDGFDEPVRIEVAIHVQGDRILVDYTGSSPQSDRGINSVLNYTRAYTAYAIKCAIAPEVPNNEGCYRPIEVYAPEGTIVNPKFPAAVMARSQTGKFLPIPVLRALAQAVPDKVMADAGAAPLWCPNVAWEDGKGGRKVHVYFLTGGWGAGAHTDGVSTVDFPSVIVNVPAEFAEHRAPILVEKQELIAGSGGAGRYRGGLGQEVVVRNIHRGPVHWALRCERINTPALGLEGGLPGSLGEVLLGDGTRPHPKKKVRLEPDEVIIFRTPGGGGYGPPGERPRELVLDDLRKGFITEQEARDVYGLEAELLESLQRDAALATSSAVSEA